MLFVYWIADWWYAVPSGERVTAGLLAYLAALINLGRSD